MRILVTGGAGFIGSNFVNYLSNKNHDLIILDSLTYAADVKNLSEIDDRLYKLVIGDICDKNILRTIFPHIEYVVHFAAESHVDNSILFPEKFISTNILGTHNLLEAAREHSIKKFLYVSTDEVYGSIDSGSFIESDNYNPSSPYSASKAAGEMLVMAYGNTFGLNYNISRCSNNYGPRQHKEKLIPCFIDLLKNSKPVRLYGDGLNVRDWIYVDDHCEALFRILQHGLDQQVYNISSSEELSNLEITELLVTAMGVSRDLIQYVEDRPGHDFRYSISSKKIFADLGFSPKVTFEEGIQTTLKWYLR
jgi:dTDP-glucose 4,6-dehydratase